MGLRLYPNDDFTTKRRLVWNRTRSQAYFRNESWQLSFEDFCRLWSTPELWDQRGRSNDCLIMTRFNVKGPWDRNNCCLITRINQLKATVDRKMFKNTDRYYRDAITI